MSWKQAATLVFYFKKSLQKSFFTLRLLDPNPILIVAQQCKTQLNLHNTAHRTNLVVLLFVSTVSMLVCHCVVLFPLGCVLFMLCCAIFVKLWLVFCCVVLMSLNLLLVFCCVVLISLCCGLFPLCCANFIKLWLVFCCVVLISLGYVFFPLCYANIIVLWLFSVVLC